MGFECSGASSDHMLDHRGKPAPTDKCYSTSWVFLSFLEFSEFFGWVFLVFQVLKLQISTQKCSRPSSDTMLDYWGRLAIGIAPFEFSWVFLSFLSFLSFSEFSEISEYHKHYFGLIRSYFLLDSVSIVHDHPIPHRHALELRTTDFSDFPPWVFWVFLVLGLVDHRKFSKSVSWAMVDSYLSWYS